MAGARETSCSGGPKSTFRFERHECTVNSSELASHGRALQRSKHQLLYYKQFPGKPAAEVSKRISL